ncbi:MAG TPA: terminase small subunit [Nitrospiraceae bacterium]|nr:terminase small subunit [Nitrospiraceae bacterium]
MKQDATTSNNATKRPVAEMDLRFGFPGKLPKARTGADGEKLFQFFQGVAKGLDIRAAARKAGYGEKWAKVYSYGYVRDHKDYIEWLQAHMAQETAKLIAVDEEWVVQQLAQIASANDYDYLAFETGKDGKVTVRRKRLDELTREQMIAIEVFGEPDAPRYRFRDRDGSLEKLGKKLGLFNERIIMEHRHRHLHVAFDLSKVSMKDLEALEGQFEGLLGEADAKK